MYLLRISSTLFRTLETAHELTTRLIVAITTHKLSISIDFKTPEYILRPVAMSAATLKVAEAKMITVSLTMQCAHIQAAACCLIYGSIHLAQQIQLRLVH